MNTNGNRRLDVPLPTPTLNLGPGAWSPDDTRITLQGWDDAHPDRNGIYTVQADGKDLVQLTTARPGLPDVPVDYSPDGASLLIFRESSVQSVGSLWLANIDGTRFRRLTPEALKVDIGGRWSPDGSKILFAGARSQIDGPIFTIRRNGSALSRIFPGDDGRFGITPTWSPDGAKIMFAIDPIADSFSHPDNGLYVMNADGTALTLVIGGSDFKREPEWRR